jgi:hypothetical protein
MANTFNNSLTANIGQSPIVVYATNPTSKATVIGINLANLLPTTITANIFLEDRFANQFYVVKNVVIPPGNSLAAIGGDQKLVLAGNNSLKVQSSVPDSLDVIVSVLEIT